MDPVFSIVDRLEKGALLLAFFSQSKQPNIWRHTSYLTVSLAPHASLRPAGPVFREQDVHRLFDQVVAEHALELVAAEAPVVRLVVIRGCNDGADVAVADLADHAAVVVEDLTHRLASLVPVCAETANGGLSDEMANGGLNVLTT